MNTLAEILEVIEKVASGLNLIGMFNSGSFAGILQQLEPLIIQAVEAEFKKLLEPAAQ